MNATWAPGAVVLSILGMAFHTIQEFGAGALASPSSGFLPVALVQLALLALWWRTRGRASVLALAATGWLQLVGGAILSVLPLPILPFAPAQTVEHYVAHLVLGLAQLPLVALPFLSRRGRPPRAPGA